MTSKIVETQFKVVKTNIPAHEPDFFPNRIKMLQDHVLRVSTPAEHESGIKKLLRDQPEGLHVDFMKIFKFVL